MESFLIAVLLLAATVAITFHLAGLKSARIVKNWFARLANGESIPEKPDVGWRFWLRASHYEARSVSQKMEDMRQRIQALEEQFSNFQHMQDCMLGSLLEGVMVVNSKLEITVVNSELFNIYQLQQSPLKRTITDALGDNSLHRMVQQTFRSGQVQTDRIMPTQPIGRGRVPSFEVSAIPFVEDESGASFVIVVFLPPPDRTRMVQVLRQHGEKVQRLADEWTRRGKVLLRSTVADEPDAPVETPAPASPSVEQRSADESASLKD